MAKSLLIAGCPRGDAEYFRETQLRLSLTLKLVIMYKLNIAYIRHCGENMTIAKSHSLQKKLKKTESESCRVDYFE